MPSHLSIYDISSQTARILLSTSQHIEAPNWTPDGGALIVNGAGRLFRVPLQAPQLVPIDTGFAQECNNDHGISPDGETLVISDKTEDGQSAIYLLPVAGGTPRRVTPLVPSYWHGWSPDGATLAYTAKRGATFQIYTCPAAGGAETQLTQDFDHCDGPDYTPCGEWIWFNGERSGAVDLWRMRPDGSDLERMTDGADVNWFPHPSPDGRQIAYLAYPPGTAGHPGGLDVELRVMPAEGGAYILSHRLHGGQGTINVPSWAQDSRQFAFVAYEPEA